MQAPLTTIVDLDAHESAVLRTVLEHFGFEVRIRRIGRPSEFFGALSEKRAAGEHLILSCHGDERGIVLPELHPSVAQG